MNTHLTPERRSDKNGNIVTRWVRGVLKQNHPSRSIPKVDLGTGGISKSEVSEIANRLLRSIDESKGNGDRELLENNRKAIERCWDAGNYKLIQLFDRLDDDHPYDSILTASVILKLNNQEDRIGSLSNSQMYAYRSFQDCLSAAVREVMQRNENPDAHIQSIQLPIHVLLHPEDGPYMESVVSRGVFARTEVLRLIEDMKEKRMSPVIGEGFL